MLVEEQGLRSFLRFSDRVVLFLHCVASEINACDVCARALSIHPQKRRGSFPTAATWKGTHHHCDLSYVQHLAVYRVLPHIPFHLVSMTILGSR